MDDIEEAEMISKDFILVKFRYKDDYYIHTKGHEFERRVNIESEPSYWTVMNNSGLIQYMPFSIPSTMAIIHSSKHQNCVLLVLEEHTKETEERIKRPQSISPELMILKLSFTG